MHTHRWWQPVLALTAPALVLVLAACNGGGEPLGTPAPTETPTMTPTAPAAGFLPVPAGQPSPGVAVDVNSVRCPPLPIQGCFVAGNRVNVYEGLRMDRAVAIRISGDDAPQGWVLAPDDVQRVLRQLDSDVTLEPISPIVRRVEREMTVVWPPGEGLPWNSLPDDTITFTIDTAGGVMGRSEVTAQWRMPEGFARLLFDSVSGATPVPAGQTATPPSRPADGIYFEQAAERLIWEGPDDRVYSLREGHCGPSGDLKYVFGIPAQIFHEGEVENDGRFFWFSRAVRREDGWRWTGYYHDDWEIWQGDDARTAYLVHTGERGIAFQYREALCY